MNVFWIESVPAGEKRWLHEGGLLQIGVNRPEILVTAKKDLAFLLQLGQSFQARRLLRFVHNRPHLRIGIPWITDLHGAQACSDGIAKGCELLARNKDAPDGRAFLAGFERHLADNFFYQELEQIRAGSAIRP